MTARHCLKADGEWLWRDGPPCRGLEPVEARTGQNLPFEKSAYLARCVIAAIHVQRQIVPSAKRSLMPRAVGSGVAAMLPRPATRARDPVGQALAGCCELGVPTEWRVAHRVRGVHRDPRGAQSGQLFE